MALVVSDTSPIRALNHLGRLALLPRLFGDVMIPPAVAEELSRRTATYAPLDARGIPELRVLAPTDTNRVRQFRQTLDAGESEAITLALEVGAAAILIDETAGRAAARRAGLNPVGVVGILILAKKQGLIPEVKAPLDVLAAEVNFFISSALRARALLEAGETL